MKNQPHSQVGLMSLSVLLVLLTLLCAVLSAHAQPSVDEATLVSMLRPNQEPDTTAPAVTTPIAEPHQQQQQQQQPQEEEQAVVAPVSPVPVVVLEEVKPLPAEPVAAAPVPEPVADAAVSAVLVDPAVALPFWSPPQLPAGMEFSCSLCTDRRRACAAVAAEEPRQAVMRGHRHEGAPAGHRCRHAIKHHCRRECEAQMVTSAGADDVKVETEQWVQRAVPLTEEQLHEMRRERRHHHHHEAHEEGRFPPHFRRHEREHERRRFDDRDDGGFEVHFAIEAGVGAPPPPPPPPPPPHARRHHGHHHARFDGPSHAAGEEKFHHHHHDHHEQRHEEHHAPLPAVPVATSAAAAPAAVPVEKPVTPGFWERETLERCKLCGYAQLYCQHCGEDANCVAFCPRAVSFCENDCTAEDNKIPTDL